MSSKEKSMPREEVDLRDVRVDTVKQKRRRNTHTSVPYDGTMKGMPKVSSRSNDFVYVNNAYVGSLNSVNEVIRIHEPPTSVYREQYWTCSKWSLAKKILAIAVGIFLGAGLSLGITMALRGQKAQDVIGGIFRSSAPD